MPPHPTSWRFILILSSHLRLGFPSGLFPSGFPTKILYTSLLSPKRTTCPSHLIHLDFITRIVIGEQYRSLSSSGCSFLHSPVTSSLVGPNILFNTLFSNTLTLRSSLNVSDQVSHPYKTTGKIIWARTTHIIDYLLFAYLLIRCLLLSSIMKYDTARSLQTVGKWYQTTRCHITVDSTVDRQLIFKDCSFIWRRKQRASVALCCKLCVLWLWRWVRITSVTNGNCYNNVHTNKYCKFILKLLRHVSVSMHHLQTVYSCVG